MTSEHRADGSLVLRERWPVLRFASLAGAALLLLLVVPGCIDAAACDRRQFGAGVLVAFLLVALALAIQDATFVFDARQRTVS